jgi:hypothetical protein
MPNPPALEAVRRSLLRRGVAPVYVARLVGELADHREDLVRELVEAGADAGTAQQEADRRLGDAEDLAAQVLRTLRRRSFTGRHRLVSFVLLPFISLLVIMVGLLLIGLALTGSLSESHRMGSLTHGDRTFVRSVCWACDWIVPAVCAAWFYTLGRRRACGLVWSSASCVVIATVLGFLTVTTFTAENGATVLSVLAALIPNLPRMAPPLVAAAAIEWWIIRRRRRQMSVA